MPDETETNSETPETQESKTDDRKVAYAERDAAKKRAREAERKAEELATKLAEREAADEAAAVETERKKNDFTALEARLKKDKEAADKRAADAEARIAARERSDREAALVDAVAEKLAMTNRTVVKGVLKALADQGLDTAPETIDDKTAADVAKQVREALGDLLPAKAGGSPGAPGVNLTTKKPGEKPGAADPERERVRDLAKRLSIR